ncbi:hypothetical protein vseg_007967 [Gypsophila vaccaria]
MSVDDNYINFQELATYTSDLLLNEELLAHRFQTSLKIDNLSKLPAGAANIIRDVYYRAGHTEMIISRIKELCGEKRKIELLSDNPNESRRKEQRHGRKDCKGLKVMCISCEKLGYRASECFSSPKRA